MLRPVRALVVDDSASMRRLLAQHLAERGYEVRVSGSGEAALEQHRREPFDLMLVDWTLPGMSGLDLCRAVRAEPGGEDVVLLVITGRSQPEDLHAVLDAGASDYLSKPVDLTNLSTRLLVAARQADALRKRRQGREALERAEEAFSRLVEAAPDAILVTRGLKVAYANPRLVRFLGYDSASQLAEVSLRTLLHRDEPLSAIEPRDGPAAPQEIRLVRRDGTVVTGEAVAVRVVFDGQPSTLVMIRDVSERKEMQARLLLADRMASVGTLAAGIAHELNNPLAYVINNLKLSREELDQGLDPERLELLKLQLEEASHGARRMREILRDLRTFARGEETREAEVDVNEVVVSCVSVCWNEIRHRARLEKKLGTVPKVRIDPSAFAQVVLNLLINAAQAVDEGRTDNCICVATEASGDSVLLTVRDSGRGIAADDMSRIFDPFFTTKTPQEGTGLGLSICRNIVTRAGGRIDVESAPGVGTTFTVRLPRAESQRAPTASPSARPRARARGGVANVLVIDDEELVGRSIRRALRSHDVQVVTTGRDAIRLLTGQESADFDIVFCDLMMPELSGMDVFEAVERANPTVAERFVFMTGGAFTPRARHFLEATRNECLEKPFDLRAVRDLAQRAVGRQARK